MSAQTYVIPAGQRLMDIVPGFDKITDMFYVKKGGGAIQPGQVVPEETTVQALRRAQSG